mgnify:CR=1 FL=1
MLRKEIQKHLENNLIPFWLRLVDDKGGFYGYMDYDLKVDETAEKGCILNSRITWFFSNAYLLEKDAKLLEAAKHGFDFMVEKCFDNKNGGVYWSLDSDGNPLDTTKHTYNQAFAIYALCAYFEASNDEKALELAKQLFELIEIKCTDEYGYLEAFTIDFKPESNEKLSENGVMAQKTMNTILHVLEAYTQLYKLTRSESVLDALMRIFDIFESKIFDPKKKRQEVFFDKYYNSIIDLHSYGHDIETAWLVDRALEVIGDEGLKKRIAPITEILENNIYEIAFDGHSLANECEKGVVNKHRVWWVQAESVVGFINAWQKSKDTKFYDAAFNEWIFIKDYVIDKRENSEWYWEVDENGVPFENRPIVEPWKCPYHNGRMCFEIINRLK